MLIFLASNREITFAILRTIVRDTLAAAENQAFIPNPDSLEIAGYSGVVRVREQAANA